MTTFDRFDPFERRITDAVHEIAAERRPAYLDDVLQLTARSSQRSRWASSERWTSLNRTLIAAAMAIVIAAVGGTYLLTRSNNQQGGPATPSPTATATPSPRPTSIAFGAMPDAVRGDWHADNVAIQGVTVAQLVRLSLSWQDGSNGWIQLDGDGSGNQVLQFHSLVAPDGEIKVRSDTNSVCPIGSVGSYRWTRSPDGLFLRLTVVDDACGARSDVFNRTWVHSLSAVNDGGLGVIPGPDPWIQVELPSQRMAMSGGTEAAEVHNFVDTDPPVTFLEIKNPMGFQAPCNSLNIPIALEPTAAAFEAYLRTLPGLQVKASEATIAGIPARAFELTGVASGACPGGEAWMVHGHVASEDAQWSFQTGEHFYAWAVVATGNLYVFVYEADNLTTAKAQAVADSIKFLNQLPLP